jgi:hypothetical protein
VTIMVSAERGYLGGILIVRDNSHLRTMMNASGAVILDTKRGKILTLNPTGAYVWQALERGEELAAIVAALARKTGEQADVLERDVRKFMDALHEQHLFVC